VFSKSDRQAAAGTAFLVALRPIPPALKFRPQPAQLGPDNNSLNQPRQPGSTTRSNCAAWRLNSSSTCALPVTPV